MQYARRALASQTLRWCQEQFLRPHQVKASRTPEIIEIGIGETNPGVLGEFFERLRELLLLDDHLAPEPRSSLEAYLGYLRTAVGFKRDEEYRHLMARESATDSEVTSADIEDLISDRTASINLSLESGLHDVLVAITELSRGDHKPIILEIARYWFDDLRTSVLSDAFVDPDEDFHALRAWEAADFSDNWIASALEEALVSDSEVWLSLPWFPTSPNITGSEPGKNVLAGLLHFSLDVLSELDDEASIPLWKAGYINGGLFISDGKSVLGHTNVKTLGTWARLFEWVYDHATRMLLAKRALRRT